MRENQEQWDSEVRIIDEIGFRGEWINEELIRHERTGKP
jgi:hypothetical protein